VGVVIFFPQTVTVFLDKEKVLDLDKAIEQLQEIQGKPDEPSGSNGSGASKDPLGLPGAPGDSSGDQAGDSSADDAMEALRRSIEQDKLKK
jgi:hypothetical protein